jgi:glycosyltransferase involved in cell wall biosynthesis
VSSPVAPLLSVVIPAYNEEFRLERTLIRLCAFIEQRNEPAEILVVENGSSDGTSALVERFAATHDGIRLLHSERGKGRAVRTGVLAAQGRTILLCDADLSMPLEEADRLIAPARRDGVIVIGSREGVMARRVNEPLHRHLMGRMFNWVVRMLAVPGIRDSQCGFKAFSREVGCTVLGPQTITGWAFDVEMLFLARRRGLGILEVPITWYFDADSRVDAIRDGWRMLRDVIRVRLNAWRGRYEPA